MVVLFEQNASQFEWQMYVNIAFASDQGGCPKSLVDSNFN